MAIPTLDDDLAFISKLSDNPNSDDGLSAAELKAKFDAAPLAIQKFINLVLIPHLDQLVDVEALLKGILDASLSEANKAAEAKATGDAIAAVKKTAETALSTAENIEPGASEEQIAQIQANADAIAALPISVNEDGFTEITGLPRLTKISTVQENDTSTMTLSYNDGNESKLVIQYEGGNPVKITVDGEEIELEWITTILQLFLNGDQCEDVTGGWTRNGYTKGSVTENRSPTLDISGGVMSISMTTNKNSAQGSVMTKNAIDLTGYSKLCFNVVSLSSSGKVEFGIADAPDSSYTLELPLLAVKGLNEIDISNVSGEYTIAIAVTAYMDTTTSMTIDSIYLE